MNISKNNILCHLWLVIIKIIHSFTCLVQVFLCDNPHSKSKHKFQKYFRCWMWQDQRHHKAKNGPIVLFQSRSIRSYLRHLYGYGRLWFFHNLAQLAQLKNDKIHNCKRTIYHHTWMYICSLTYRSWYHPISCSAKWTLLLQSKFCQSGNVCHELD